MSIRREFSRHSRVLAMLVALTSMALITGSVAATPGPSNRQLTVSLGSPTVLPDGHVTFSLSAPQATQVMLNFQNSIGPSPAATPIAMTKDANGVWSVTVGPLTPNLYGYGFIVDGAKIADPANRDIWSGTTSAWSNVLVPGPEAAFFSDASVPHGAWATVRYFSEVTQTERQMQVYTPPGYGHDNRRYPVLYLMHGGGGNDTDWIVNMRANYIMDNLIAQHKAVPMIVVMPDGYLTPPAAEIGAHDVFPQELLGSIVPTIEQNYRVAPGPKNRALAGLSLGGMWTMDTLLQDPGAFAYLGVFSSCYNSTALTDLVQNHSDLLTNRAINKETKLLWITIGDKGLDLDANAGVGSNVTSPYYGCAPATRAVFDQYHIKYTFVQGTGSHVWDTWRHNLLTFAPLLFR
jgi:enterochelin esterase-like enzyme